MITLTFLLFAYFFIIIAIAIGEKNNHSTSYAEQKAKRDLEIAREKYRIVHQETLEANKELRKWWNDLKATPRRKWQELKDNIRRHDEINKANKARFK